MTKRPMTWQAIAASFLLLATMSCAALGSAPTPKGRVLATPTATPGLAPNLAGGVGGNGGNTGGQGGQSTPATPAPTRLPSATPTPPTPSPTPSPTPNLTPSSDKGPFVVKQIETLGHETIQGLVCDITKPFSVSAAAPQVSWTFNFVPTGASKGSLTYVYTISSAGESHDAAGTYTLSPYDQAGALLLTMTVRDHVVFKGFDGTMPVNYKFALLPVANSSCP